MLRKSLLLGLIAGILSGMASIVYQQVYTSSLGTDFTDIVPKGAIMGSSVFGCLLAASGYALANRWFKTRADIIFNLVFVILCFGSIISPFAMKLPLTVESPELFPGLVIPMHFFPPLAWLTLRPLFFKSVTNVPQRTAGNMTDTVAVK